MSYIITATVDLCDDVNAGAKPDCVQARVLDRSEGRIVFDVPGTFGAEKAQTLALCADLVNAGFVAFDIEHSY